MSVCKFVLVLLSLNFIFNLGQCTEFMPVYLWSTQKANEKIPALHKISQDAFKDIILERMKENKVVIVFVEETLSPEDYAQHDQSGGIVYPNLAKFINSSNGRYFPHVQHPIKVLEQLDVPVTQVPLEKLVDHIEFLEDDVPVVVKVQLEDPQDAENRQEFLRHHDALIGSVFKSLSKKYNNLLAIYTGYHRSWVGAGDIVRNARALLAASDAATDAVTDGEAAVTNPFYNDTNVYLYVNSTQYTFEQQTRNITFTPNTSLTNTTVILNLTSVVESTKLLISLNFTNSSSAGYWVLVDPVHAYLSNTTANIEFNLTSRASLYAPRSFSYHCGDQVFSNVNFSVTMKDFQVQVFFDQLLNRSVNFGDAYDCVGFTSVPIWSGIFVTSILLLIMTFGITMMMDIRTMDRFDDAKGKTITINAE